MLRDIRTILEPYKYGGTALPNMQERDRERTIRIPKLNTQSQPIYCAKDCKPNNTVTKQNVILICTIHEQLNHNHAATVLCICR